jgi:2-keto-3-deoxy-L-rhamnonate aldolase RhmA
MIGVMIENHRAMACIDDILAVDGLDFVLFGPADYSMSLGWRGPAKERDEIQAALQRTIVAAKKAGKHVMLGVGTGEDDIRKYHDMGVTMFEFASDLRILASIWEQARHTALGLYQTGGQHANE